MDTRTSNLHIKADVSNARPNVTLLFQCSSFFANSDYFYTRKSNPNSLELEEVFKSLEGSLYSLTATTGMAALNLVLNLLKPGDHLIINKLLYGCTYKLCKLVCRNSDIKLDIIDLTNYSQLKRALNQNTRMILFETPTNPFLKTINISNVSKMAKKINNNIFIAIDNTWATPYFQKPLNLGADISIYSASKYYSGHSDVLGGVISTNDKNIHSGLEEIRFYTGAILDPHSAWLIRRGMQTFFLRMEEHRRSFFGIAKYLNNFPQVAKVYIPKIDKKQLTGYGGILFFEIAENYRNKVSEFINALSLFEHGTSMASTVSAVAQPYLGSHISLSESEKRQIGLKETLIRLSIGFEKGEDLMSDLKSAFDSISQT